jgi:hypothetical protein
MGEVGQKVPAETHPQKEAKALDALSGNVRAELVGIVWGDIRRSEEGHYYFKGHNIGSPDGSASIAVLERATELLLSYISYEEFECFKKHSYIPVEGKTSKFNGREVIYRIYPRISGGIEVINRRSNYRIGWLSSMIKARNIPLIDLITAEYVFLKMDDDFFIDQFTEYHSSNRWE